jgi:prolyl-tRNA synthetase
VVAAAQNALFAEALARRDENTVSASTLEEAEEGSQSGFAVVPGPVLAADDGEGRLNAKGVTVRLLRRPDGLLPGPEDDLAELEAVVARAY